MICQEDVGNTDKAFQCALCKHWEHVDCIRECESLDGTLYEALVRCHAKCLSFTCTCCRIKGLLAKQFIKCEFEIVQAQNEWLARAFLLEQLEAHARASEPTVIEPKQEHDALEEEMRELHDLLKSQKDSPSGKMTKRIVTKQESKASEHESLMSSKSKSTNSTTSRRMSTPVQRSSAAHPHSSGFQRGVQSRG